VRPVNLEPLLRRRSGRLVLLAGTVVAWVLVAAGGIVADSPLLAVGAVVAGAANLVAVKVAVEAWMTGRRSLAGHEDLAGSSAAFERSAVARIDAVEAAVANVEGASAKAATQIEKLRVANERDADIPDRVRKLAEPTALAMSGRRHQQLARLLPQADADELIQIWFPVLGLSLDRESLFYVERRVIAVENLCIGRLASSTSDAVFRTLVARSLVERLRDTGRGPSVLEIGVLYGVNSALMWDVVASGSGSMHQTLLDLYDGYYESSQPDRFTGLVVTEAITRENMRRVGAGANDFCVVKGSSYDDSTVAAVSDRSYELLLIDGDHSYEGVKNDFDRYSPLVAEDGIVLVDDYGSPSWPDVGRYVDEIRDHPFFELVGVFQRTAVLRRRHVAPEPTITISAVHE
jgi:Methyltransferase domain